MPDCQMCWNEWPTLVQIPIPQLPVGLEVCRNCDRSVKKVYSFSRAHGFDLATGEISTPHFESQTQTAEWQARRGVTVTPDATAGDQPPDPPAKKPGKAA